MLGNYLSKTLLKFIVAAWIYVFYVLILNLIGVEHLHFPDLQATIYFIQSGKMYEIYSHEYIYTSLLAFQKNFILDVSSLARFNIVIALIVLILNKRMTILGMLLFSASFAFFSGTLNQNRAFLSILLIFWAEAAKCSKNFGAILLSIFVHMKIGAFYILSEMVRYFKNSKLRVKIIIASIFIPLIVITLNIFWGVIIHNFRLSEVIISYSKLEDANAYPKLIYCVILALVMKNKKLLLHSPFNPFIAIPILIILIFVLGHGATERFAMALIVYYSLHFCGSILLKDILSMRVLMFVSTSIYLIINSSILKI